MNKEIYEHIVVRFVGTLRKYGIDIVDQRASLECPWFDYNYQKAMRDILLVIQYQTNE